MSILNYPGFILAGILFVILCVYVFRFRQFRIKTERTIKFLQTSLTSALEQLRGLRK